jgi:NitT/TauT family transport system substrate-binding protein
MKRRGVTAIGSAVLRSVGVAAALAALAMAPASAQTADRLKLGTNWKAQAEHGGFYQALGAGIYKKHGIEVEIRQGGPQVNHPQLLAAGVIDANMSANTSIALNFLKNNIPMVTVAAFFQKDPQALLVHPDQGYKTLADFKGKPIMISADSRETWWLFLKLRHGFEDAQVRPYTFQMAPFIADKKAIQQAYATAEPYYLGKEGIRPDVHLLANYGWPSYSQMITVAKKLVDEKPDLVQRFINASIEGWYSYIYGDPSPGNALIKRDNPDMTDGQIAYSIGKMKEYGLVETEDTNKLGIGAMTEERLKAHFDVMAAAGVYPQTMKYRDAFDLRFVNKRHAVDMKR